MTERLSLVDLLAALERAASTMPPAEALALLGELEKIRVVALFRMVGPAHAPSAAPDDVLLNVPAAARRLGMSVSLLYKRHKTPPWVDLAVPTGVRRVRFSAQRIDEYLRQRA
jgi:predicted DNA-binding transcriptional regulator AlpA